MREHTALRGADPTTTLERLAELGREALVYARANGLRVIGVGVALPGLVEASSGVLLRAPNLGWIGVDVGPELERLLGPAPLSVVVENEANLAALAELWVGAADGLAGFIHVTGEVGIGSGIVVGGELYRGGRGFAGEIGHFIVRPDGAPCACGSRGCLETVAGIEAIRERAGLEPQPGIGERAVAALLAERAASGDVAAIEAIEEAASALGIAVASAVNLLDLDAVILGGSFTPLGAWLVPRVREALGRAVLSATWSKFDVRVSQVGVPAAARGAAAVRLRELLGRPWLLEEPADTPGTRRAGPGTCSRRRRVTPLP